MTRSLVRYGYAPLFFVGFLGAAILLSRGGTRPAVLGALLVLAIFVSFVAEQVLPYERAFNWPQGDIWRDVAHALVNEASNALSILSLPIAAELVPGTGLWPADWPMSFQLLLAVIVADLGITLAHFVSHRSQALWRFHAVHHSVERMYGFNGLVKHPLHQAFELTCASLPLLALGMPVHVAWLLGFAVAVQLLLQHSNVDVRLGPFVHVWAVAPAHRFHHLSRAGDGDVNFALFSSLWDHLLGTFRYDPARTPRRGELGIEGRPDYPTAYVPQLHEPFRRQERKVAVGPSWPSS
jgi:sterol desaturase/sphingolipid hydroxylase (fatty acid hydroxylase superfamily)